MTNLEQALQKSYDNYEEFGARSPKKLAPLHKYLSSKIKLTAPELKTVSMESDFDGELKVQGMYYPKNVDIALVSDTPKRTSDKAFAVNRNADIELVLGVKFVTSNFKQNANNYFEGMMGETANIQAAGVKYGHFIALPIEVPYFDRSGVVTKLERLNEGDLQKYLKLMTGQPGPHKPEFMAIALIKFDFEQHSVELLPDSHLDTILPGSSTVLGLDSKGFRG